MADEGRPSEGDHIGPYRVEQPLGAGGMGEVVLAYDERLDRRVAIKRIRHTAGTTDADRARFRREARVAAGLSHPAIVQVHDILSEGDDDAIVMELVQGRSVAERLKAGPLPLAEVLRLARDVAEGLAEAHRVGLVHRDLKAENVMVTPSGHAKILDFGLAKRLHHGNLEETLTREETLTEEGALIGTVRAMAPEQAVGRQVDQRSDLFSLGVLLYEMVTGHSPFRAATALLTLRRVVTASPRPSREHRPDVPLELARLIERLLEKAPEHRPEDASEVTRTLETIAVRITADRITADRITVDKAPTLSAGERGSFSDAPTGSLLASGQVVMAESTPPMVPESGGSSMQLVVVERRWLWAAFVFFVATMATTALYWRAAAGRPEPLRVVVPRPDITAVEASDELDLIASGVLIASLSALADLDGIAPVEPTEIGDTSGSAVDVARAVSADEVLSATIERRLGSGRIVLRRIRDDGEVLWAKAFDVPLSSEHTRLVAEAVAVQLRRAYPGRQLRAGVPRFEASDDDYGEFVRIVQRLDSGDVPWEPELELLEAIVERSPRFLEAHLEAASVAWTLYSDSRETEYLERSEKLIRWSRELEPDAPRILFLAFRIALARGERAAAEVALAELLRIAPNEPMIPLGRSFLAESDGDLSAAAAAMRTAVDRFPSWRNLYRLAEFELRRGEVGEARRRLEELLQRVPNNTWGLAKLAQVELFSGDLGRVEELLVRAIEIKPHRSYFVNLGIARFLLGRYGEAHESYLQALEMKPGHLLVRLNLADTELALGHELEARARYRQILGELEQVDLDAAEGMIKAQCLARLGAGQQAVALTLETLRQHPEDAEVAYLAGLVYTLVGETTLALVNIEKALAKGIQPRWFDIPGFDTLRSDPRFKILLEGRGDP